MRFLDRQRRVEECVYDSIEELAEEFDLNIPFYPEVKYLGRGLKFEDLKLLDSDKKEYDSIKRGCPVLSYKNQLMVFSRGGCTPVFLREEATHFLHAKNSHIKYKSHTDVESDKILIMREMLGFFGSLVLGQRKNPFRIHPDLYNDYLKALDFTDRLENECGLEDGQIHDYWVHKQGYCMGQMLFAEYSAGKIPSERITSLFRESFTRNGRANAVFKEVRSEIGWPLKV